MFSLIERCSSEVSCVTIAMCAAQAFLRHAGDILAVDQDAAARGVVEMQQQVDEGRLAGAGRPDQPDALARLR